MKWCRTLPLHEKRDVPSGMTPWPCVPRMRWQRFVCERWVQYSHVPHVGMYNGITTCPTATVVTPSPIDSTMPQPSWPRIAGSFSGSGISIRSVWQTPQKSTLMRTSPAAGGATSISSILSASFGAHSTAALHVIVLPTVESSAICV
eukprot:Amastigsp_a773_342.p3 type:complete len:147 gc:universal Amastigsp_a773_342:463-23(-)